MTTEEVYKHMSNMKPFAKRFSYPNIEVDEIIAQALLEGVRALASGYQPKDPKNWCMCIIRRQAAQIRKKKREEQAGPESWDPQKTAATLSDIEGALKQIPEPQRTAAQMYILGHKQREIAEHLGVTDTSVHRYLKQAMPVLREILKDYA